MILTKSKYSQANKASTATNCSSADRQTRKMVVRTCFFGCGCIKSTCGKPNTGCGRLICVSGEQNSGCGHTFLTCGKLRIGCGWLKDETGTVFCRIFIRKYVQNYLPSSVF